MVKKFVNEKHISRAFSMRGILGVQEYFSNKVDIFLFEDDNSRIIFDAYEKDELGDDSTAYLLMNLVLKYK